MMRVADIIQIVSLATDVDILDMVSARQAARMTHARHLAMYLSAKCLDNTQTEIGLAFGKRDHSSVAYAIEKIDKDMETDATLKALVNSLKQTINYRMTLEAIGKTDVLAVARRIALQPRRGAIEASTRELASLAVFALDLWEVASCAEALALGIRDIDLPEPHDQALPQMQAFAAAIIDEMNHIAGPRPTDAIEERTPS